MNCPLCDRPMSSYWLAWSLCFSCGLVSPDQREPTTGAVAVTPKDFFEPAGHPVAA
jgi:hypothetical protein